MLFEIGAIVNVLETFAVKIVETVWERIGRRQLENRRAEEAKAILGIEKERGIAYRHDSVHPLYGQEELHPDNLDALRIASGSDIRRAQNLSLLESVEKIFVSLEQNMVLLGSPTAEGLSRVVFGYREGETGDTLIQDALPLDLPYRWQLNAIKLDPRARARRFVRGRGIVERPNWFITSERFGRTRLYIPAVDNDGFLETDYLLVTRVRNFLTSAGTQLGRFIISFGGTHGTGTRAIDILFSDRSTLSLVAETLKSQPASYQLLFRVSDMLHDPTKGTRARRIELVDAAILADSDELWHAAYKQANSNLLRWLAGYRPTLPTEIQ